MHGKRATRERRQCANRVCGGVFVHWELMWQCGNVVRLNVCD